MSRHGPVGLRETRGRVWKGEADDDERNTRLLDNDAAAHHNRRWREVKRVNRYRDFALDNRIASRTALQFDERSVVHEQDRGLAWYFTGTSQRGENRKLAAL